MKRELIQRMLLFVCLLFTTSTFIHSQDPQPGGFIDGWDNYDQSMENGLGSREINFDFTGVRAIHPAPEIGIHPRIFFGPDEIPDIKNRLENLQSGQAVAAQIHAFTTLLHLSTNYNSNADYARDADNNRYIDNTGFWNSSTFYYDLINEEPTVWDGVEIKRKHLTSTSMALEAFECLLHQGEFDEDTQMSYDDRASNLAKAMAFWASLAIDDPDVNPNSNNFNHFGGTHMALAYDLNYYAMTEAQRDLVRTALAKIIPDEPRHGPFLPAYANTSNWSTLNSFEIIFNLAIEGEPGYKPALTERWMRAVHNFITYGWYPSGAGYEGLGKNYQFSTTLIACAKRGYSLLGHPHVRAYATEFLPAILQPFGKGFTSYDVWGGSGHDPVIGSYKPSPSDLVGLKWIFPEDKKVDFIWRNYIESNYNSTSKGYVYQQMRPDDSYYNYLLPAAIFCQDYHEGDWDFQSTAINRGDYFASDRGLAVLRSGPDSDDLALQFHCRQDMGGHTHGDRNDFTLSALGRIWVRKSYAGSPFQANYFHSCVTVDGKGIAVTTTDGKKCRQPGTILDYQSTDEMSIVAGDATYAYSWEWRWSPQSENVDHPLLGNDGWEKVTETWNDFQYIPQSETHFDIPFYDFAAWHQPYKYERMVKRPFNPMEKVYRTIALIKGDHPFVLIADDLKKNEETHQYKWLAQIARDLEIESTAVDLNHENYRCDVILKEPETTGNRRLLVRILHNEGYDPNSAPAMMDTLIYEDYFSGSTYNSNPNYIRPRLIVESNSVEPDFKIMLYPFDADQELPITKWNITKDTLETIFSDTDYKFAFNKNEMGRTEIETVEEVITSRPIISNVNIDVFPNPTSKNIFVEHSITEQATFTLYDSFGKKILIRNLSNTKEKISLARYPNGIYWYEITSNHSILESGKVVKVN